MKRIHCCWCKRDISKWNLDHHREIICDRCTQHLMSGALDRTAVEKLVKEIRNERLAKTGA